jgi:Family of unknown function (DUF6049)
LTVRPAFGAVLLATLIAFSWPVLAPPASAATPVASTINAAIVVPITVPARTTGLISSETLANYTAPLGLLNRELDEVIDRPVVLGIDPMIIASIRVLGRAAPASAMSWLDRLNAATNETFALTYADSDITASLQAGSTSVLGPKSFDFAVNPAQIDAPVDSNQGATPTPSPTAAPGNDYTTQMLAWDYSLNGIAWPAPNSVRSSDLDSIVSSGYVDTILSSDNVNLTDRSHAYAQVDDHTVFVNDDLLSDLFNSAVRSNSTEEWATATASLVDGITSVLAGSSNASPAILVALDRNLSTSDPDLGRTIDAISSNASVRMTGLSGLSLESPIVTTVTGKDRTTQLISAVSELLATETLDVNFASIATTPALIAGERRLDLLALLSIGWNPNPEGWSIARGEYETASKNLRDSVKIVKSSSITLLADRASLPITVSNALDQAVTVYIVVRPLSPLLSVENSAVELTIEPRSQRKGQVPVQSLSNGTVELELFIRANDGTAIGGSSFLKTNVQAGWETPVTISVGALVVLIFVFGIYRSIRRRRRLVEDAK